MRVSDTISVAAGATTANLLLGLAEGLLMGPTWVRVMANAAATGVKADYRRGVTPLLGADGAPVNVGSGTAVSELNGDTLVKAVCQGQQSLRFTNSTAGAIVVTYAYDIPD